MRFLAQKEALLHTLVLALRFASSATIYRQHHNQCLCAAAMAESIAICHTFFNSVRSGPSSRPPTNCFAADRSKIRTANTWNDTRVPHVAFFPTVRVWIRILYNSLPPRCHWTPRFYVLLGITRALVHKATLRYEPSLEKIRHNGCQKAPELLA
jgi:hypothetical protein